MLKKHPDILAILAACLLLASPAAAKEKAAIDAKQIEQWRVAGINYYNGNSRFIRQNYDTARELFEKAGAEGDAISLYYLGNIYNDGLGVEQDEEKARLFYQRAAELGHGDSQMLMGVFFVMNGIAERNPAQQQKTYETAVKWLEKAVKQENMEAAFWLGEMLRKGLGVKSNEVRGVSLIRTASNSGNANAQAMLAGMHWKGESGVAKDLMNAHALAAKSYRGGNPQGEVLLQRIESEMTDDQRKTARELAKKAAAKAKLSD